MKEGKETIKYMLYQRWWKQLTPDEKREYTKRKAERAQQQIEICKRLISLNQKMDADQKRINKIPIIYSQ